MYATNLINLPVVVIQETKNEQSSKIEAYIIFMVCCLETNDFFFWAFDMAFHSWLPWNITLLTLILWLLFSDYSLPCELVTPKNIYKTPFCFCFRDFIYPEETLYLTHLILSALGLITYPLALRASVVSWKVSFPLTIKT